MCYFCDKNNKAGEIIKSNLKTLNVNLSKVLIKDYQICLKKFFQDKLKFDIVFLDPPYHENMLKKAIDLILDYELLNKESLLVCETDIKLEELDKLKIWKQKKYGDKYITIYRLKE
jgi:16S rRNA (guanine966-N2)-methyltransferase